MRKGQSGFTMVELVIVIAVLGIFATIAVVKIDRAMATNDLINATNQMAIDIKNMQHLSLKKTIHDADDVVNLTINSTSYQINNQGVVLPIVKMPTNIQITADSQLTYNPNILAKNQKAMIKLTNTKTQEMRAIIICQEIGRIRISTTASYLLEEQ